jgi:hypothetical protein
MRTFFIVAITALAAANAPAEKLTFEDRVEITRGLTAEYATSKILLPRSKKPLEFEATGKYNKEAWDKAAKQGGPAARSGDLIQITKVDIEGDKLVLEINGGYNGGRKWYHGIQIGGGTSSNPRTVPIARSDSNAAAGTAIVILFHKELEPIKAAEVKKMLASIFDFEQRTATQLYVDTLTPEMQQAVKEKRATVGMDRDQVILAMGRPIHKSREVQDGMEIEDWVYGQAPGKITFVTFNGDKVIKVKESYAGLGTEVADPPVPR